MPTAKRPGRKTSNVPAILRKAAKLFEQRNKVYGNNYRRVGRVMAAFMDGKPVTLRTASDYELWHLFELVVVKLTRFSVSGLTHQDSIHDAAVYTAMVESVALERARRRR